jgi:hypothetical protein
MKKIKFISVLVTFICFAGCSNDDSENKTNTIPQELIGKWKATYYEDDVIDVDQNGNPIIHYLSNQYTLELKSNGTFTSNEFTNFSGGTFTYVISGGHKNYLKFTYSNDDGSQLVNYKTFDEVNTTVMKLSPSRESPFITSDLFPRDVFLRIE